MKIIDSIFFHEDDYCLLELLPIQNLPSEISYVQTQSDENSYLEGFANATTDIEYPLFKLGLTCKQFEILIKKDVSYLVGQVYTGYSSYRELKSNITAYGLGNYVLYAESNNDVISKLWINYTFVSDTFNGYPHVLERTLHELGLKYDLVLFDWSEFIIIILKDKKQLLKYISHILC
jgi:hypothetical protein